MIYTDVHAAAPAFRAKLEQAQQILLLTHINPDGDAIGSVLGAYHALQAAGKNPHVLLASPAPSYTLVLPASAAMHVYQRGETLPAYDLIWMLDTAAPHRVGLIAEEHLAALLAGPLMITDHHVTNDGAGHLNLIDPQAASNADLLFRLLQAMEWPVPPEAATCLYFGVTTDTQSFQTSATRPQTLRTAADLLEAGADHRMIIDAIYFNQPESTARLSALALAEVQREGGLLWTRVTQAHLAAANADDEAADDTVGRLQRIAGMRVCALFKERADGTVKVSLRSVPGINVAAVAQRWGGGGHTQAAGASLPMGLDEAEAAVLAVLRELVV
ncbi:MAG: DHH family phosphoesterase [Oscillochloridaceae bacterium umkhey_bin13]